jgi:leucyl-tRNA synthetase
MEWNEEGVEGVVRFVRRLWRIVSEVAEQGPSGEAGDGELARAAHRAIAAVTDDLGRRFQFNTPIARIRELVNALAQDPSAPGARLAAETAVQLIQPYAPHLAEELWAKLGHERLWEQPWPVADDAMLERDTIELVLQVNGKVRDRLEVPAGLSKDELIEHAKQSERVLSYLNGGEPRKVIVVPDKLVNIVV